jgi:hypothetical protein
MMDPDWTADFPGSVVVCDLDGIVIQMNRRAVEAYQRDGGRDLIGKNLLECHPEPARTKLKELLKTGGSNVYTIQKNGIKKLIYQAPWYQDGRRSGMVELALEIPLDMPHFVRIQK